MSSEVKLALDAIVHFEKQFKVLTRAVDRARLSYQLTRDRVFENHGQPLDALRRFLKCAGVANRQNPQSSGLDSRRVSLFLERCVCEVVLLLWFSSPLFHLAEREDLLLFSAFFRFASVGRRGRKSNAQICRRRLLPSFCIMLSASSRNRVTNSLKSILDPVSG
ncbi:MAG: hypothetical protein ACI9FZ_000622 [Bacteroidia bacterium]